MYRDGPGHGERHRGGAGRASANWVGSVSGIDLLVGPIAARAQAMSGSGGVANFLRSRALKKDSAVGLRQLELTIGTLSMFSIHSQLPYHKSHFHLRKGFL